MTNYNITKHSAHDIGEGKVGVAEVLVDFTAATYTTGDVLQCIKVNEGMKVTKVDLLIVVADAGTENIDIGDGTDPNGYDDNVDMTATAGTLTRSLEATDPYGIGKYYTTDDTIDILVNTTGIGTAKALLTVTYERTANATVISTL